MQGAGGFEGSGMGDGTGLTEEEDEEEAGNEPFVLRATPYEDGEDGNFVFRNDFARISGL